MRDPGKDCGGVSNAIALLPSLSAREERMRVFLNAAAHIAAHPLNSIGQGHSLLPAQGRPTARLTSLPAVEVRTR